ncbi:MAG: hypothetical protein ABWZ52_07975 [Acidimicrobiales bacterium]
MIDDARLRWLAATQRGLVTVEQAAELGFGQRQRDRLVDGCRWQRATPRVLRLTGSTDTVEQRALIAVLDAGRGGALAASSAAAWWGIPGNRLEPFHVVRWRNRSDTDSQADARHEPTALPPHHIVTLEGIPTQVPARALFDIAGTRRRGAELPWWIERMGRMVDNAWSARLVSGATMHDMLDDLAQRGRPGIRVMRQVLATRGRDYVPPASNLESRVIRLMEEAGLPPMRRQVDTGDSAGWIGRVDLRDEELPLIAEIQSERFHTSLIDKQLDEHRISRLERAGFVVVELIEWDVWHRPRSVIADLLDGRRRAARLARRTG